jgi:ADP-heptose:LPS heptosyltransferase
MKKFLIKHVGNMGDMIFFIPPVLETLKKVHPDSHITFVTAWGFKNKRGQWGKRNQSGFSIALMLTNPHIDQLIHWHDTKLSLSGDICVEEGHHIPTWNKAYYDEQKRSGGYDAVYELDFGLATDDDPIQRMYQAVHLPDEHFSNYKIYLTEEDKDVAREVMASFPMPRIVLLEGIEGATTRGWDPTKVKVLSGLIKKTYGTDPIWFGGRFTRSFAGQPLTLRQNIATLLYCDVAIGVMGGPLHFAAAIGLPTLTLFADQPLHRAAPAYFLNEYIDDERKKHRTIVGPTHQPMEFLKNDTPALALTPQEAATQGSINWLNPGRQSTKTALAVIEPTEVMAVLQDMLL